MQTLRSIRWSMVTKVASYLLVIFGLFYAVDIFAADDNALGAVATRLEEGIKPFATLIVYIAYISGLGFVIGAMFKFKQHKDNPTQIPLGTPLALLVIGVVLIFLPALFGAVGSTVFGNDPGSAAEFSAPNWGSGGNK